MKENSKTVSNEISFKDLFMIFKRCWWLVVAVAIVLGAGTYAVMNLTHKDEYTATATIWAIGSNANTSASGGQTSSADVQIAIYLINDYKELIKTRSVMEVALQKAGSSMSQAALKAKTVVENTEDSHVMHVSVTASDPKEAQKLANELSKEFCRRVNEKNKVANVGSENQVERPLVSVWDEATLPKDISNPVSLLLVILIALLGGIAVYVVFLVIHLMDDKINTTEDVEKYLGLNLLGVIPNKDDARRRGMRKKSYYHYTSGQKQGERH